MKTIPNKNWLLLIFAVGLSAVAAWLTMRYLDLRTQAIRAEISAAAIGKQAATVQVIVPRRDLPAGTVLDGNVVAAREVPADLVYDTAIRAEAFDAVQGKALIRGARQGRPLQVADLRMVFADFSGYVPAGKRAMTVAIDELNSNANMLQPGNLVDLMLVLDSRAATDAFAKAAGKTVVPFMSGMKVLATGQQLTPGGVAESRANNAARSGYTNLTLEVTPEQAGKLALATEVGTLRAVLRNAQDASIFDFGFVDSISLLAEAREAMQRNTLRRDAESGPLAVGSGRRQVSMRAPQDGQKPTEKKVEYIIGGGGNGGIASSKNVSAPLAPNQVNAQAIGSFDSKALAESMQKQITEQLARMTANATTGDPVGARK